MVGNLIWLISIALETAIIFRGALTGLCRKYPLFYAYIACILAKEIFHLLSSQFEPNFYARSAWPAELVTIIASYAVVTEILRWMFRQSPAVARPARKLLLLIFVVAVSLVGADLVSRKGMSPTRVIAELSRDLRYIEAALLMVMLWLFGRYQIAIERNLFGLMLGFSFWVSLSAMNFALLFIRGSGSSIVLRQVFPALYVITLAIWCVTLWSLPSEQTSPASRRQTSGTAVF